MSDASGNRDRDRSSKQLPASLGKYTFLKTLGRGGKGVVVEALDTVLRRKVALKLIHGELVADPVELEAEGRRFLTEARISANLPKHPGIVGVYEAGEIDGKRFLAMELVEGRPLQQWRKAAAFEAHVRLLREVALALEHAHLNGVVHRDVKPQNILVDAAGRPHLTDWGLAKVVGQEEDLALSLPGRVWGTPSHMSPEHARGRAEVDHRTDVWSLGVLLYEAIAGRPPFKADNPSQLMDRLVREPVPPPGKLVDLAALSPLHRALEPVCMQALAKDPEGRTPSAQEFADRLGACLEGGWKRRKTLLLAGAGAAALAVVTALVVLFAGGPGTAEDLARADGHLAAGRPQEAIGLYERVLDAEPENPRALEGRDAARKRLRDQIDLEKRREVDEVRRKEQEKAQADQEELKRRMATRERADAEEALRMKMEQARLEAQLREARERAAEEARKKIEEPAKPAKPAEPPPAPAPVAPAPPKPAAAPVAPAAPTSPTGEAERLADGTLRFEAENFTGGAKPVEGADYHDTTPGNSGKAAYRAGDVDVAAAQDGAVHVVDAAPGEWLRFRGAGPGKYRLEIRYSDRSGGRVHLEVDGANVTGPLVLAPSPDKRGWLTFAGPIVRLSPGPHDLRFVFDATLTTLDFFELKPAALLPLPDAAKARESESAVRELFKEDYAKRSPADLQALSKKLLQEALKLQDDPAAKFVFLSEARELSAQAGDVQGALAAIAELERTFEVDGAAQRAAALPVAARSARSPEAGKAIVDAYLAMIGEKAAANDFEGALALASKAEASLRGTPSAALAPRIQARSKEIAALRDEHKALEAHLKTLKDRPDDPAANLAAGLYWCFSRGDWEQGLPLLAKGFDPALAALARGEAAAPTEPVPMAALGDGWREAADKRTGPLKPKFQLRALHWYEGALPGLTALARLKVEAQVEALYRAMGGDGFKKGLVFWLDPGKESDAYREFVSGAKPYNNGSTVADSGGRALSFARKLAFVEYPASQAMRALEGQGSIFVWVNHKGEKNGCLVSRGEGRTDDLGLWIDRGRLEFHFQGVDSKRRPVSKEAVPRDKWTLVGAAWDGSAIAFTIDGKEDASLPFTPPDLPARPAAKVRVGCDHDASDEYTGLVGPVLVYNRALTESEATQLYMGTRFRFR